MISLKQPPPHLQARLRAARAALARHKCDGLLVSCFTDVSYLTGFEGDDSWLLLTPRQAWLISDSRYQEQISRECPWVATVIRRGGMVQAMHRLVRRRLKSIAVQAESLTLRQHHALQAVLRPARIKLRAVTDLVVKLRHIKDEQEIAAIEQAVSIAEHAFEALRKRLRPGLTENDIAGRLTYEMRRRGATGAAFDSIVAAGANAALAHYRPGAVKFGSNMALLVDWGATFQGYRSDLTRMIFAGRVPEIIRKIYAVVLTAQLAAIDAIRPGRTGRQIDRVARHIITRAGYGPAFGHGLGHGIGRDIHEGISLSARETGILQAGMVLTVEPGIYLPGIGGVRIEDDVLVTPHGARVLSRLPKDLHSTRL